MIDAVKAFLSEHELIRTASPAYNIMIGRSFIFEIFERPHTYITVKVSRNADLQREFESQRASYSVLPEYVPEPLAFGESKGLFLLASEGVPHVRLTMVTMRGARKRIPCAIGEYARRSTGVFVNQKSTSQHLDDLDNAIYSLRDRRLAIALGSYIRSVELEKVHMLPHIRQHGDFVINNIGITDTGIVIFDWEDFGRVELPGFDIGLLLMSCLGYNADFIKLWFEQGVPQDLDEVIAAAREGLGLSRAMLWMLLPLYLVHFLYLKEMFSYRPMIRDLVRYLITDLLERPPFRPDRWHSVRA